jgi:hypothetical protein
VAGAEEEEEGDELNAEMLARKKGSGPDSAQRAFRLPRERARRMPSQKSSSRHRVKAPAVI